MIGLKPIWARISPANSPQGPAPTTTGRVKSFGRLGDQPIVGVGPEPHLAVAGEPLQHGGLVAQRDVHRIDHQDRRLLPRIMGAAGDDVADQVALGDAETVADGGGQGLGRMVEGERQVREAEHGGGFSWKHALAPSTQRRDGLGVRRHFYV
jgi:hypothetical protein